MEKRIKIYFLLLENVRSRLATTSSVHSTPITSSAISAAPITGGNCGITNLALGGFARRPFCIKSKYIPPFSTSPALDEIENIS
ncbi:hypothetical protein KAW08_04405 [bacterium]|nr:hypothetical protein [bacterium]